MRALVLTLLLSSALPACNRAAPAGDDAAEEARVALWRKTRLERLTSPTGWLTLAGLHWLKSGTQTVGSAEANDLRFPAAAPAKLGTLYLDSDKITFTASEGVDVKLDGKPVQRVELVSDEHGKPTLLTSGTFSFFVIKRNDRYAIRLRDTESKPRREFHGIEMFPARSRFRVTARWEPADKPVEVPVPTILGTIDKMPSPGVAAFELDGQTLRLRPVLEEGDPRPFFIFADATTGKTTYGAGRFLYADPPQNGQLVLDFNQSYNPPCAFTPYATCPLPPEGNKLALAIEAGEKNYGHH